MTLYGKILKYFGLYALLFLLPSGVWAKEKVVVLSEAGDALQAQIDLIRSAKMEVNLSYFIWRDDRVGRLFLAELRNARKRNPKLKVRIAVDALANRMSPDIQKLLVLEGIEIREYNRSKLMSADPFAKRLHDKVIVVDGEKMIVGDRNVADEYYDLLEAKTTSVEGDVNPMRSRSMYIEGKSARGARHYFMENLWDNSYMKEPPLPKRISEEALEEASRKLDVALDEVKAKGGHLLQGKDTWKKNVHTVPKVAFLHDPVGVRKGKSPGLEEAIYSALRDAKPGQQINIQSPYFTPTERMAKAMEESVKRGVKIRVLTNSTISGDNKFVSEAYEMNKEFAASLGIELWEYDGPRTIHIKSVVTADKRVYFGSFNMHARSEFKEIETGVELTDKGLAKELLDYMEEDLKTSTLVAKNGKLTAIGKKNHCAPGSVKRVLYRLLWNLI